jgi:hypothetical protein
VVVLALFFGALLDADSLVAAVSSERFGTARSIELALVRPFKTVSDAVGLNLPHRWLADIGGTNQHHVTPIPLPQTGSEIAAGPPAAASSEGPLIGPGRLLPHRAPAPTSAVDHAPAPAATKPAPAVRVLTPTAATPLKVWLAGDSMIGELADAFLAHVAGNKVVSASENMQIGTGLARPDVFDWPGTIVKEIRQAQPNVVVLTFGANDDQDMMAGGKYLVRATPAWQAEYARRVSFIMSTVAGPGRMLVWMEMPAMARPRLQQTDQIINRILRTEAKAHPGVVLIDPGPVVAPNGTFTSYLPGSSGQQVQVRTSDGVHLTPAGAGRVLPLLLAAIRTGWHLG